MRAEEMVVDPWTTVPPVRTIVLDRPPAPARPVREREALRRLESLAGPERLTLRDVGIAYAG